MRCSHRYRQQTTPAGLVSIIISGSTQYHPPQPHVGRRAQRIGKPEELSLLADDVYQYFGLGCRTTKVYVPEGYDFIPLRPLTASTTTWAITTQAKTTTTTTWRS